MKIAYAVLLGLSIPVAVLSVVFGRRVDNLRRESYRLKDRAAARARREQDSAHIIVLAFSLPYYLAVAGTFVAGFFQSRRKGWRIGVATATVLALVMSAWSLLLSGAISFDEVYFVWIAAVVVFVGFAIAGLVRSEPKADR